MWPKVMRTETVGHWGRPRGRVAGRNPKPEPEPSNPNPNPNTKPYPEPTDKKIRP